MRRQLGSVNVIVILLVGCAIAAAVFFMRPKPETRELPTPKPPVVSVIKASPQSHQITVHTQGTVTPSRTIDLVAEVSGRVLRVSEGFANGAFSDQGEMLIELDNRDYQYRVVETGAQVAAARRELAIEKGQARQAKREWRDLGSADANGLFLRKPQVKAAEAQLASAIAQQQQAQLNFQRTKIHTPFNGRIESTQVNVGQYVTAGTVIARIYDSQLAEVRLSLTDEQVAMVGLPLGANLNPEQYVQVTLSARVAGQMRQWPASIVRTESSIDSSTRFYFALAEIEQPFDRERYDFPLVMGLFVEAEVAGLSFDDVIRIPEKAVFNNHSLFVVNEDNILQQRRVDIVSQDKAFLWVRGNLRINEKVVVSDPKVLHKGMLVTSQLAESLYSSINGG